MAYMPEPNNRLANVDIFADIHSQNVDIKEINVPEMHSFWKESSENFQEDEDKLPKPNIQKTDSEGRVRELRRRITGVVEKSPKKHPVTAINEEKVSIIRHLWEDVADGIEYRDGGSMCDPVDHDNILPHQTSVVCKENINSIKNILEKESPVECDSSDSCDSESGRQKRNLDIDASNVNSIKRMWQQKDLDSRSPRNQETSHSTHTKLYTRRLDEAGADDNSKEEDSGHCSVSSSMVKFNDESLADGHTSKDAANNTEFRDGGSSLNSVNMPPNETSECEPDSNTPERHLDFDLSTVSTIKKMWQENDNGNPETAHGANMKQRIRENVDNHSEDDYHESPTTGVAVVERKFCLPEHEYPERSVKQLVEEQSNVNKEQSTKSETPSFNIPEEECPSTSVKQIAEEIFTPLSPSQCQTNTDPGASKRKWRSLCRHILSSRGMKYFTLGSITVASFALLGVTVYPDLIFGPPSPPAACKSCIEMLENIKTVLQYTPLSHYLERS